MSENSEKHPQKKKRGCLIGCLIPILVIVAVFGAVLLYAAFRIELNDSITYTLDSDYNVYYVTGAGKNAKDVVIPATYNGLPVVGIGGFISEDGHETYRGGAAEIFGGTRLESIILPETIGYIGYTAFRGCEKLKEVTFRSDGALRICAGAFSGCDSLEAVSIENAEATTIGDGAFSNCTSLTTVVLGSGELTISPTAFEDDIYTEYENAYYFGNADNPHLILVKPKNTGITECAVHANTKTISGGAFADCMELTSVSIPEGVETIGSGAFQNCVKINKITLPRSLKKLGYRVFEYCQAEIGIYQLQLPEGWDEECFNYMGLHAKIVYVGEITPAMQAAEIALRKDIEDSKTKIQALKSESASLERKGFALNAQKEAYLADIAAAQRLGYSELLESLKNDYNQVNAQQAEYWKQSAEKATEAEALEKELSRLEAALEDPFGSVYQSYLEKNS